MGIFNRKRVMVTGVADFLGPHLYERPLNDGSYVPCADIFFTALELARKVIGLIGSCAEILLRPLPSDAPQQRQPGITLAQARLGWNPYLQLWGGLPRTIDHFRGVLASR